jgi:hypothetical protein
MEGREKPHTDKYKIITNDRNYDASCKLTSILVWNTENFKCLIFVAQSVPESVMKCVWKTDIFITGLVQKCTKQMTLDSYFKKQYKDS